MTTEDLWQQANNPPPGGGSSTGPTPVGVPEGYVATRTMATGQEWLPHSSGPGTVSIPPRYTTDDLHSPAAFGPERIAELQQSLLGAGVYDDNEEFRLGVWDDTSRNAYKRLLGFANASGLSAVDALNEWSQSTLLRGDGSSGRRGQRRAPLTIDLPSPMDVAAGVTETTRAQIGKALESEDVQRYVADYQQLLSGHQQQQYATAETGGTVTAPPSLDTFTEARLKEERPQEVFNTDLLTAFDSLAQMMGQVREVTL